MMAPYKKIAVLGGGAFGVALSKLSSPKADNVVLWCRDEAVCEHINRKRRHPSKLNTLTLPGNIVADIHLPTVLKNAEVIILTLPLEALPEVLSRASAYIEDRALIVSTAKGIAQKTLYLPKDIIHHAFPSHVADRACYLSGPSFASELAMGLPTAMTLASFKTEAAYLFQKNFSTPHCRLYFSPDVIGVCVGGALKNVIAIAAGACAELELGKNAQASLITRGLAEMARLAQKMGGQPETLMGLSGVGDLVLSATDPMSRNFKLGTLLAQGYDVTRGLEKIGGVVEGANTAQAIGPLMKKYDVELPISLTVFQVLYQGLPPLDALSALLKRELKDE